VAGEDVVILGAGFSHAISDAMPTLDDLGTSVLESLGLKNDLRVPNNGVFDENFTFETWLTLLSENQPHLSVVENAENAALFLQLRDVMTEELSDTEGRVLQETPPSWLRQLTLLLHFRRATVITFNYDRLLEAALERLDVLATIDGSDRRVGIRDALWNRPPVPRVNEVWAGRFLPTLRLLKLHGSLDWWIAPLDVSGTSLIRNHFTYDRWGKPSFSDDERSQLVPGRDVFIVPPTSAKSTYYQNLVTRELWRSSYDALRVSTNVALVGYSFPAADAVFTGMLESSLRGAGTHVDVVNPDAEAIGTRLKKLGMNYLTEIGEDDCVAKFTASYLERANEGLRFDLANYLFIDVQPDPVVMTTHIVENGNLYWRITAQHLDAASGLLTLNALPLGLLIQTAAADHGAVAQLPTLPPTSQEVKLAAADARRIVINDTKGRTFHPVDVGPGFAPVGGGGMVALLLTAIEDVS
jgi:hypothetical protein